MMSGRSSPESPGRLAGLFFMRSTSRPTSSLTSSGASVAWLTSSCICTLETHHPGQNVISSQEADTTLRDEPQASSDRPFVAVAMRAWPETLHNILT